MEPVINNENAQLSQTIGRKFAALCAQKNKR